MANTQAGDRQLSHPTRFRLPIITFIASGAATLAIAVIRVYQVCISPLLGPRCRFYPSCSQYTQQAIARHGLLAGTWLGIKRVTRCHPGCEGGIDEVPGCNATACGAAAREAIQRPQP